MMSAGSPPSTCCADAGTRRGRSSTASTSWNSMAPTCAGQGHTAAGLIDQECGVCSRARRWRRSPPGAGSSPRGCSVGRIRAAPLPCFGQTAAEDVGGSGALGAGRTWAACHASAQRRVILFFWPIQVHLRTRFLSQRSGTVSEGERLGNERRSISLGSIYSSRVRWLLSDNTFTTRHTHRCLLGSARNDSWRGRCGNRRTEYQP